jgi:mannose-6-phosphate isomerase class I
MLTYNSLSVKPDRGVPQNKYLTLYRPPIEEFQVEKYEIPNGTSDVNVTKVNLPAILLVISGKGEAHSDVGESVSLSPGLSFFQDSNTNFKFSNSGDASLIIYRSFSNPL